MNADAPAVLVVEDNDLVRDLCARALRSAGVSAIAVGTADDGVDTLQRYPTIEVLVTDLGLPGELDGRGLLDVARRSDGRRSPIGLVVATGAIGPLDDLGDDVEILQKPFTIDALMDAVERARQRSAR